MTKDQINVITRDLPKNESQQLLRDLEEIRVNGYSISKNERVPGALSISAPVFSYSGNIIAGLTMSGPVERFSEIAIENDIDLVVRSAREISNRMGAKCSTVHLARALEVQ